MLFQVSKPIFAFALAKFRDQITLTQSSSSCDIVSMEEVKNT
jgi:hypothetical protein